ncbi:MAG TPA: hypothetical protein VE735_02945 [Gammaproteobacteria bacterium]|jgi:hypothetical protein|nr:hypothetical protein [Gammaproteobacteria bacterium]
MNSTHDASAMPPTDSTMRRIALRASALRPYEPIVTFPVRVENSVVQVRDSR